ncbi:hypothetical protein P43SY_006567 [Pythium insidiosum]|uniref:Pre-mRNA-splicing factor 38 n=1 Tax=Pythium insidiosum TaxID=114742 RepID=A0AAD5LTV7_PYTIN|nr:hypothetical protein P43SY_006567 [Pythium insidiosum]
MANATDPGAQSVHGVNPQHLIEKIMRNRIYASVYWKEQCFGLTAESLVDKAIELNYFGGTFGGNQQPTPFLCLLLKMLQLQPELEIVQEFIQNGEYKYLSVLGAVYLRLVGKSLDVYRLLEPMYSDYRKIRKRNVIGWEITHVDEIIDSLLTEEFYMDLALPRLVDREYFEKNGQLPPRRSVLEDELEASDGDGDGDDDDIDVNLDDDSDIEE